MCTCKNEEQAMLYILPFFFFFLPAHLDEERNLAYTELDQSRIFGYFTEWHKSDN